MRMPPQMKKKLVLGCKCHARKYASQLERIQQFKSSAAWPQESRLRDADDFQALQLPRDATTWPGQVDICIGEAPSAVDNTVSRGYIWIRFHSSIGNQPFFSTNTHVRNRDLITREHNALDLNPEPLAHGLRRADVGAK